jgi:hypothetical protein
LLVAVTGVYGLISILFDDRWLWGGGFGIALGAMLAMTRVLLQPIRHRWPALLGGLAAGLILWVSVEQALAAPRHIAASAGLLASVAAFASITHLPMRRTLHDPED